MRQIQPDECMKLTIEELLSSYKRRGLRVKLLPEVRCKIISKKNIEEGMCILKYKDCHNSSVKKCLIETEMVDAVLKDMERGKRECLLIMVKTDAELPFGIAFIAYPEEMGDELSKMHETEYNEANQCERC